MIKRRLHVALKDLRRAYQATEGSITITHEDAFLIIRALSAPKRASTNSPTAHSMSEPAADPEGEHAYKEHTSVS